MKKNFILFILLIQSINVCFAKAEDSKTGFTYIYQTEEVIIDEKGNVTIENQSSYKIVNEIGLKSFNIFKIVYENQLEDVEIVRAEVVNNLFAEEINVKENTTNNFITDKNKIGLTNTTELSLAVPNLKINSILNVTIKTKLKNNLLSKYFSQKFSFGNLTFLSNYYLTIRSQIPFFYHTNFPDKTNITVTSNMQAPPYTLRIVGQFPDFLSNFLPNNLIFQFNNDQYYTIISTSKDWDGFRKEIGTPFYTELNKPLPTELVTIVNSIKRETSPENKLFRTLEYITSNYRYLGNWQSEAGLISPKELTKTVSDKFGDCKDFSTILSRMLKELGIQADLALVERGYVPNTSIVTNVVNSSAFNHVITRVVINGKVYWIDPTNTKSIGLLSRKDILNKTVLNLNPTLKTFETVTSAPEDNQSKIESTFQLENNQLSVTTNGLIKNEMARILTDQLKGQDRKVIDSVFKMYLGNSEEKTIISDELPNFDKPYYENIKFKYSYIIKKSLEANNEKTGFKLVINDPINLPIPGVNINTIYNVLLSINTNMEKIDHYTNLFLIDNQPRSCDLNYLGIRFSKKTTLLNNGFDIITKLDFDKEYLTNKEIETKEFAFFLTELGNCVKEETLIISNTVKKHQTKSSRFNDSIANLALPERINKRIAEVSSILLYPGNFLDHPNSFGYVEELLLTNLAENSKEIATLNYLGELSLQKAFQYNKNYENSGLQKAYEYYNKALLIDPNNLTTQINIMYYYMYAKAESKAEEIFNKYFINIQPDKMIKNDLLALTYYSYKFNKKAKGDELAKYALNNPAFTNKEKSKIFFVQGLYLDENKQYGQCVNKYEEAIKLNPTYIWAYTNIDLCLISINDLEKRLSYAQKAYDFTKLDSFLSNIKNTKAEMAINYLKNKKYDEAEKLALESLKIDESVKNFAVLTTINVLKSDNNKAASYLQRLISAGNYSLYQGAKEIISNFPNDQIDKAFKFLLAQRKNDLIYENQLDMPKFLMNHLHSERKHEEFIQLYKMTNEDLNNKKTIATTNENKQFYIICSMELLLTKMVIIKSKENMNELLALKEELFTFSPEPKTLKRVRQIISYAKEI